LENTFGDDSETKSWLKWKAIRLKHSFIAYLLGGFGDRGAMKIVGVIDYSLMIIRRTAAKDCLNTPVQMASFASLMAVPGRVWCLAGFLSLGHTTGQGVVVCAAMLFLIGL